MARTLLYLFRTRRLSGRTDNPGDFYIGGWQWLSERTDGQGGQGGGYGMEEESGTEEDILMTERKNRQSGDGGRILGARTGSCSRDKRRGL